MVDKLAVVQRWLFKAENDLRTARIMIQEDDAPTDVVCFHAQQCVEKCLKGFLVSVDRDFPKIHDLSRLLSLCCDVRDEFLQFQNDISSLTDYAVGVRYVMDDWEDVSTEDATLAIKAAERLFAFVADYLSKNATPIN